MPDNKQFHILQHINIRVIIFFEAISFLLSVLDTGTKMTQRLDKLLAIRTRIIGDFDHHIVEIGKFTHEAGSHTIISFRNVAFEKTSTIYWLN